MTFDLEKAQRDLDQLMERDPREQSTVIEAGIVLTEHMQPALDEIARQNASLDDAEALIKKNAETMNAQAKRIAELQSLNEDLMKNGNALRARAQRSEKSFCGCVERAGKIICKNRKQRAALKKLGKRSAKRGKALVEAIAAKIYYERGPFSVGWGDFSSHPDNLHLGDKPEKYRQYAREQLYREGLL